MFSTSTAAPGARSWRHSFRAPHGASAGRDFQIFIPAYNVHVPDAEEFYGTPIVHTVEHRISQLYWTGLPRGPIPRARKVLANADARESVVPRAHARKRGIASPADPMPYCSPAHRLVTMGWPVSKYAEIARWMLKAHGITSVVNWGPRDEGDLAAEVRREMEDCAVVPGAVRFA